MPEACNAGSKVPEKAVPPGPVHVPPASGVPPNETNKAVGGLEMHKVSAPSDPGSGGAERFTVTVLLWPTHGGGTVIV